MATSGKQGSRSNVKRPVKGTQAVQDDNARAAKEAGATSPRAKANKGKSGDK